MPSITTFRGFAFPFDAPESYDFCITEIATALSNICRFNGHCEPFYSVAQHSVLVSQIHPSLEALMHDAAEAYIGDVSSPLKSMLPDYREIEGRLERAIRKRFNLCYGIDAIRVEFADKVALAAERRDLMPFTAEPWQSLAGIAPLPERIAPLRPKEARDLFLTRFAELDNMLAGIHIHSTEDEMIFIHQGGKYLTTYHASCPEQAADFVAAYGTCKWPHLEDCIGLLKSFQQHWKSKDTEDA